MSRPTTLIRALYRRFTLCWRLSAVSPAKSIGADPLLRLRGSGKKLWANEHADVYVRRLRD